MEGMTTVTQGTVGLGIAVGYFASKGLCVSLPLNDNQGYDLIVDDGSLKRVQVKTTRTKASSGNFNVQLKSVRSNKTVNRIVPFDKNQVELLFIATSSGDKYVIPASEISTKSMLTLDGRYDKFRAA